MQPHDLKIKAVKLSDRLTQLQDGKPKSWDGKHPTITQTYESKSEALLMLCFLNERMYDIDKPIWTEKPINPNEMLFQRGDPLWTDRDISMKSYHPTYVVWEVVKGNQVLRVVYNPKIYGGQGSFKRGKIDFNIKREVKFDRGNNKWYVHWPEYWISKGGVYR